MIMKKQGIFLAFLISIALCVSGCYSSKQILVKNDKDSNYNLNLDAVPITIFLFQLKDIEKFKDASPLDLIERSDVILGKDKIDITKMQIAPDNEKTIATINKNEVPYVGLLAVYSNMGKKRKVKALIESDEISRDLLELQIKKNGVFIIGNNSDEELIK